MLRDPPPAYSRFMRQALRLRGILCAICLFLSVSARATTKVHVIAFGKPTSVPWFAGSGADDKPQVIKIRALIVDGRVKEYIFGSAHEVTDRLFVVRRVFRLNDSLPEDAAPHWQWQRGGWLLVDRTTGRISPVALPEYDAFYSSASWYRDYAAYCGVSDDGKTIYAMVEQVGRRKPVLKKSLSVNKDGVPDEAAPNPACAAPSWERSPARVSFEPPGSAKQTFAIRGHVVDLVSDVEEEEDASK